MELAESIQKELNELFPRYTILVDEESKEIKIGCTRLNNSTLTEIGIRAGLIPGSPVSSLCKNVHKINENLREYVEKYNWSETMLDFIGQYVIITHRDSQNVAGDCTSVEEICYIEGCSYYFPSSCVDEPGIPHPSVIFIYSSPVVINGDSLRHAIAENPISIRLLKDILIFKGLLEDVPCTSSN